MMHDAFVEAGRLETVPAAIALALAMRIDDPGMDTGSSQAAVAKQLDIMFEKAMAGVKVAETPLEKIRRERQAATG